MKSLIIQIYTPTPIFEIELELIYKNSRNHDSIIVLQCDGGLETCFWNKDKHPEFCALCRSRAQKGLEKTDTSMDSIVHFQRSTNFHHNFSYQNLDELMELEWRGINIGKGVASSIISLYYKDHKLDVDRYRKKINQEIDMSISLLEDTINIIDKEKPDQVFLFNGRISQYYPVRKYLESKDIKYYCYEVSGSLKRYMLRENSTPHSIAYTKKEIAELWGEGESEKVKDAEKWFATRRGGSDQGIINFTKQQKDGLLPSDFDHSKRNIVMFNSSIEEYCAVPEWTNEIYHPDETEGARQILESFLNEPDFHFYYRIHPHMKGTDPDRNTQIREIIELDKKYDNVSVIYPEEKIHTYALIDACEKAVTFGSTIGVEAAFWGTPSLLAGRSFYEDFDCIYNVDSHEEMTGLIKERYLPPKPANSALMYGYREACYGVEYEYYAPETVSTGRFRGEYITPDRKWVRINKIMNYIYKIPKITAFLKQKYREGHR